VEPERPSLDDLERRLGVTVRRKDLLELALIHHSGAEAPDEGVPGQAKPSNERLEFLGDAVLGAAAASFLYRAYPELDEGPLTALRSALVRRSMVACYAEDVGLEVFVPVGPAEEGPQGRGAASVLSAAFEAVVGAIFLDRGFASTARFLAPFFRRHLPLILAADLHRNAKSELQEYTQGHHRVTPTYRLLERRGPPHDSRFVAEVVADGLGSARGDGINRRAAEQAAAHNLLELLRASSSPSVSAEGEEEP
jgi:ribonuclease III